MKNTFFRKIISVIWAFTFFISMTSFVSSEPGGDESEYQLTQEDVRFINDTQNITVEQRDIDQIQRHINCINQINRRYNQADSQDIQLNQDDEQILRNELNSRQSIKDYIQHMRGYIHEGWAWLIGYISRASGPREISDIVRCFYRINRSIVNYADKIQSQLDTYDMVQISGMNVNIIMRSLNIASSRHNFEQLARDTDYIFLHGKTQADIDLIKNRLNNIRQLIQQLDSSLKQLNCYVNNRI